MMDPFKQLTAEEKQKTFEQACSSCQSEGSLRPVGTYIGDGGENRSVSLFCFVCNRIQILFLGENNGSSINSGRSLMDPSSSTSEQD